MTGHSLENRLIVVTGASSGIGRATAQVLDRCGARLLLVGRNQGALDDTRASLSHDYHATSSFDLCAVDGIQDWLSQQRHKLGAPFDGLVHSAGIGARCSIRALARQHMDDVFTIHVFAALALIRAISARVNLSPRGGSVVLLSSVAALSANPGLIVYGAAKAALHAVARTAAGELAEKHVRVNCLAPAYVDTPMLAQAREQLPGEFDAIARRQRLGWVTPEEVGAAASFLLSDASRSITGSVLPLDGGFLL